jgi:hypothetical protein
LLATEKKKSLLAKTDFRRCRVAPKRTRRDGTARVDATEIWG